MTSPAPASKLAWLGALLLILFVVNLATGSIQIPLFDLLRAAGDSSGEYRDILLKFRLPKALTCVLAGAALSVSGLLMQTTFRNPLAGPDVLGLSSGASLMVAIVIMTGQSTGLLLFGNPWLVALAATAGAVAVFIVVLLIARLVRDNTSLLIIGLMISASTASLVGVIQFMS